jgi:hypothetical protein
VILSLWDRFAAIRWPVILCVAGAIALAAVYSSGGLRRLVRFEQLVARLPGGGLVRSLDEAVLVYSRRPGDVGLALALSLANHACVLTATLILARGFGESALSALEIFAAVAVGNMASALPVAPAGWGVGEAAYGYLFAMLGSSATVGVATSITFRLVMMAMGLVGGLFLLLPGGKATLHEAVEVDRP